LHRLVKTAHDRQCPDSLMFLALGAYVGIRACEVGRLTWGSLIDVDGSVKKHLALSSAITKTSRRRAIPITSAAAAVISEVMKMHLINPPALDRPVVSRRHRRNITATVEAAGVEWIDNGLRKGYVSSCVALFGAE